MSDDFPRWPPEWLEDHGLANEEELVAAGDVELISGLRADGQILMSVTWPEGRRYMLIDPVGGAIPKAFRVGERAEDGETSRLVEGVWSQALALAKQLIDGEITSLHPAPMRPKKPWRRGVG